MGFIFPIVLGIAIIALIYGYSQNPAMATLPRVNEEDAVEK
jgi:hypothetical protein